jgi:MbtH protein
MVVDEDDDKRTYIVVINHEEQYSIWLKGRAVPTGWKPTGKEGLKADCLAYVDQVWTDMRPLSLRKKMQESAPRAREN